MSLPAQRPSLMAGHAPYVLSLVLAVVAAASSAASLAVPDVLLGPAVSQGNLRGTAVVVLVAAAPLLLAALRGSRRGTQGRWLVVWLAAVMYLTYQGVLFCFGTPMNRLFLGYVAWLGLGVWSLGLTLRSVDAHAFARRTDPRLPARLVAGVTVGFAALNGLAWIARIFPSLTAPDPGAVLAGSGMLTSPVWVQDLAVWIPAAIVFGVRMWRRRDPWGTLLTGAMLAFYVIESVSIASDQWFGAQADASYPDLASTAMVAPFLVVAAISVVPLAAYLRRVDAAGTGRVRQGS